MPFATFARSNIFPRNWSLNLNLVVSGGGGGGGVLLHISYLSMCCAKAYGF